ncbi:endophilin-B1-like isoform X2 [Lampris incognitus]|uniref:endophilin-B1-like isoform X2 n=1 Tax=Lampris incognitus TaxID=2546036 RepID=UPI0024B4F736|nr:endophilin-B1-like isoform X2 [Lampris incognitus]
MDLTRWAVDAGQLVNRAVQYTGESVGQAERTELNSDLEELLARAESTKMWTDQIISQTEVLLQPNTGARLEDRLYELLDWSVPPRPRAHEVLGDYMSQAGLEMGPNTPYGAALLRCGEVQKQMGEVERKFTQSTNIHFLTPLRSFTEGEYSAIQNLNANPLDDAYVTHVSYMFSFLRVKWLKMWAQEITQAEMELRICQSLFDRQSETTRRLLERISSTHTDHMRCLTDFVDAQACYYAQCHQHAQELQKQLASIPAVRCSNNWQIVTSSAISQPPTGNHVDNEAGLEQATPVSIVIHQFPDFNQAPTTGKATTGSSVMMQPPDQASKNNNNNNASQTSLDRKITNRSSANTGEIESSATRVSLETQPLTTNRGPGQTLPLGTEHPSSTVQTTDQLAAPNGTASSSLATNGSANDPQTTNEMLSQPLTTDKAAGELRTFSDTSNQPFATNGKPSRSLSTAGAANEPRRTNGAAGEPPLSTEMACQPLATNGATGPPATTKEIAILPLTAAEIVSASQVGDDMATHPLTTSEMAAVTQTTTDRANESLTADDDDVVA